MKRCAQKREKLIYELSKKNRWYNYERQKKHLSSQGRETEVRILSKDLKI